MDHQSSPFLVNSNGTDSNRLHQKQTHAPDFSNIFGTPPPPQKRYRRNSFTPLFGRDDSGVCEGSSEKYINDPIHGHVLLDPNSLSYIDTPQFQRLRDLKRKFDCKFR
ncbi:hypothetical protein BGZ94_004729 [Podila epigama]|nr:hypothetical protein BGZ94_004729 [Podila epigama]